MRCASTYVSGSPQHRTPGLSTRTKRGAKTQGGTLRTRFAVVKTPRRRAYPYFTADTYTRAPYAYPSSALRRVRYDDRPPMSRASMRRQSRPAKTKAAPRERNAPTAEVRPTPRCACTRRRKRYASDRHREANRSIPCLVAHSATRKETMAAPTPKHERMAPSVRCSIPVRRWASRNPPPSSPMSQIRRWPSGPGSTSRMACQHFSQAAAPPLTRATARRIRACDFKTCARER